jgi:hypothetical protein
MLLNDEEARVVGSLMEKELTTPQQYPLSALALQSACNQSSNREPVVSYDEETVRAALDTLKEKRLVRFVLPSHGRSVVRFRHVLDETLALDAAQRALMAVLLLRGPQTVGELRIRTERMAELESLTHVERELMLLGEREDPLALRLDRRPGQKEERWACPLVGLPATDHARPSSVLMQPALTVGMADAAASTLEDQLRELRGEVAELREALEQLRAALGD